MSERMTNPEESHSRHLTRRGSHVFMFDWRRPISIKRYKNRDLGQDFR